MKENATNIHLNNIKDGEELLINLRHSQDDKLKLGEELCRKCGLCCHARFLIGGLFYIDRSRPCKYLKGKLCSIYENRGENEDCISIEDAIKACALPVGCGYVKANWQKLRYSYRAPLFGKGIKKE
jgi:uncharacterized cysteine cluster protein YcgN (CxxCxxCC family)